MQLDKKGGVENRGAVLALTGGRREDCTNASLLQQPWADTPLPYLLAAAQRHNIYGQNQNH
jgi:hypothetical protein